AAAYQHALIWKITGKSAHGDKAVEILNDWSATHTKLTGNADRYLASGLFGYQFANAAEMMRDYPGFEFERFKDYLLNVFYYPLVERFLYGNSFGLDHNDACITNYLANWDLCNMAAMIAIGILCDNREIYNKAIAYFKTGGGNGCITHAANRVHSPTLAQWEESGR
ncbi:alginate lyase family protein, partial [Halomonas sp. EGI 63088]